ILALVAQKEREMIQKRVKDALCICRQNNIKLGTRTPELNVRLMNEGARKARIEFRNSILPIVYEIKSAGVFTLQGIASCLNKRGVKTRTGKGEWQATQIRNLLVD
ncbi:MAG: resolvase, partial [Verrucomicrobia bacterium]|nr:resolvase [Verrucomicrobiota bacterium]